MITTFKDVKVNTPFSTYSNLNMDMVKLQYTSHTQKYNNGWYTQKYNAQDTRSGELIFVDPDRIVWIPD